MSDAAETTSATTSTETRTGADRDWPVEQRGVMIVGENPMIVLYRADSEEHVAIASLWTSRYSPAGQGKALVIWCDPEATGMGDLAPIGMFTDNPDLARYVWANFYKDYGPIQGRGVEEAPIREARFSEESDGLRLHRVMCVAGETTIELEWRDVIEVFQSVTYPTGFEVSIIAGPCAGGAIIANGVAAQGEVHVPEGWFHSTSLLAWAETWIALDHGEQETAAS